MQICFLYQEIKLVLNFPNLHSFLAFVFQVPRFKFPVMQYPISLEIRNEDGHIPVETPYLVTVVEVNGRKLWEISRVCFFSIIILSYKWCCYYLDKWFTRTAQKTAGRSLEKNLNQLTHCYSFYFYYLPLISSSRPVTQTLWHKSMFEEFKCGIFEISSVDLQQK